MYDDDYWKRVGLQQICEFICSGSGDIKIKEKGTPKERHLRYGMALGKGIRSFRDKIINYDWDSIGDDEAKKQLKTDEMFEEIITIIGDINQLSYEMGFVTGLKIQKDIFQITQIEDAP